MKYARILMALASEPWAIQPEKLEAIIDFLALQASGEKLSAEQIEARIAPQTAAAVARKEGSVAILPLRGVIANRVNLLAEISGGTSCEGFGRAFASAINDDQVKAVILDVDSPGGTVQGTEELSAQIFAARGSKPIVAHVNATMASAAYWIGSAADEVVVTPTGWVGSIGVMTAHEDVSAALEKLGVKRTLFTSSPHKGEQSGHLPLSDEARQHIQGQVNTMGAMFVDRVAANRGVATSLVRETYGMGRMVLARQAVADGMADRVATLEETVARFGATTAPAKPKTRALAPERERRSLALN